MAENTHIEWCRHTFNPWVGCTKLSPACDHCYAESWAKRAGNPKLWQGERRRTTASNWQQPLKWDRQAVSAGRRDRVFCASLADVFDNQVPTRWRDDLWHRIEQTPNIDWMLLTKRPENIAKMLPTPEAGHQPWGDGWPNVWLGTTVEDAERKRRIGVLRNVPAVIRFLSCEPLLGDLGEISLAGINLVIVGGESGPQARPMHPAWARSIREQCAAAGVAFFFKQWGEWIGGEVFSQGDHGGFARHQDGESHAGKRSHWWSGDAFGGVISTHVGKKRAGRLLDGRTHDAMPEPRA